MFKEDGLVITENTILGVSPQEKSDNLGGVNYLQVNSITLMSVSDLPSAVGAQGLLGFLHSMMPCGL